MLYPEPSMKGGSESLPGTFEIRQAPHQRCLCSGGKLQDLMSEPHGQRAVPGSVCSP